MSKFSGNNSKSENQKVQWRETWYERYAKLSTDLVKGVQNLAVDLPVNQPRNKQLVNKGNTNGVSEKKAYVGVSSAIALFRRSASG